MELAADRVLYAALAAYTAIGLLYLCLSGQFDSGIALQLLEVYGQVSIIGYCVTLPLLLGIGIYSRITFRLPRPRRALAWRLKLDARNIARLLAGTALLLAMIPFRAIFTFVKLTIPQPGGFAYDGVLADIDKALHFDTDPFHFLLPFFDNALALRIIELNYNNLWFVITFGSLYVVAISPRFAAIRVRFVMCFLLAWALTGTLVALLGSSAGPVFYGAVTGDYARFADLVALVDLTRGQPASAAGFQDYLWAAYVDGSAGIGSGISAFPSVHVAIIAMLAFFVGERGNRWWTLAAWSYVAITVMCSVYLGWHYAVDGYAAIALAAIIHFGVKALMTVRWGWRAASVPEAALT